MNDKINGFIVNENVYIPTTSESPCKECDVKSECQHGMLIGKMCSMINEDECFKFSQELTDKLNGK